jgi:hypothetical protein
MSRRNIVQYKPKGPANIFAPIIRFNGMNGRLINEPNASSNGSNYVVYPNNPTVEPERQNSINNDFTSNHFDELYESLFQGILESSTRPYEGNENYNVNGYSDINFNLSNSLQNELDCIREGGNCVRRSDCPRNMISGLCMGNNVCCNDTREPSENNNGNYYTTGNSYRNDVTGGYTFSSSNRQSNLDREENNRQAREEMRQEREIMQGRREAMEERQASKRRQERQERRQAKQEQRQAKQERRQARQEQQEQNNEEESQTRQIFIRFNINFDNLENSDKRNLRNRILTRIRNEIIDLEIDNNDILIRKATLTQNERRLQADQQFTTEAVATLRDIYLDELNDLRESISDTPINIQIGSNTHRSIQAKTTDLSGEAEYNERNNAYYYGNERQLRQNHRLSADLERMRRQFGSKSNLNNISDSHCERNCGRVLVTEEENQEGYLVPVESPYYRWREECNNSSMRRRCGDCGVCNGEDPNDLNNDNIPDVKQLELSNIRDPDDRDIVKQYLNSFPSF